MSGPRWALVGHMLGLCWSMVGLLLVQIRGAPCSIDSEGARSPWFWCHVGGDGELLGNPHSFLTCSQYHQIKRTIICSFSDMFPKKLLVVQPTSLIIFARILSWRPAGARSNRSVKRTCTLKESSWQNRTWRRKDIKRTLSVYMFVVAWSSSFGTLLCHDKF